MSSWPRKITPPLTFRIEKGQFVPKSSIQSTTPIAIFTFPVSNALMIERFRNTAMKLELKTAPP